MNCTCSFLLLNVTSGEFYMCAHVTFLLESSLLKVLAYWKLFTLKVQKMLPLLKKLTFPFIPQKVPQPATALSPTSPATLLTQ